MKMTNILFIDMTQCDWGWDPATFLLDVEQSCQNKLIHSLFYERIQAVLRLVLALSFRTINIPMITFRPVLQCACECIRDKCWTNMVTTQNIQIIICESFSPTPTYPTGYHTFDVKSEKKIIWMWHDKCYVCMRQVNPTPPHPTPPHPPSPPHPSPPHLTPPHPPSPPHPSPPHPTSPLPTPPHLTPPHPTPPHLTPPHLTPHFTP